jgi:hypothetical protein
MAATVESLYANINAFVIQLVVPWRGFVVTIEKDLPHRDSDDLPMRSLIRPVGFPSWRQ